ncbi:preprotein translocase subunit SecE [Candidatus Kinetoplastibacterium desouzaii TCC079E]|uniref:Preprotein translocase subunit SecE n=1 Tax=Candidatus Kinetoplastidibacterium desouzai TCC079E TaxID=1208919 RepID=M1LT82_9PROT|nr:preprotein translocase subunit SecE [Candidatus Kinetoplastibacterium desouzaii]AGF47296.1 preprotein translocase subunit SecE [Candidatus Kinetoplastibacterium desouzaii TCC079E]
MSISNLENYHGFMDRLKLFLSIFIFLGGFLFLFFDNEKKILRLTFLLLSFLFSFLLLFFTSYRKLLFIFFRDSFFELKLVSWPSRKESLRMTGVVFVFAFLFSLFICFIDKCIEFLLYCIF